MLAHAKALSLGALGAGGGFIIVATTQTWLVITMHEPYASATPLEVAGSALTQVDTVLGFVLLALLGVLLLSGRLVRIFLAALAVLAALGAIAASSTTMLSPLTFGANAMTAATGLTGAATLENTVADYWLTAWPFVCVAAGILALVGALLTLATNSRWPSRADRYAVTAATAQQDHVDSNRSASEHAVSDWDSLSSGADPTE